VSRVSALYSGPINISRNLLRSKTIDMRCANSTRRKSPLLAGAGASAQREQAQDIKQEGRLEQFGNGPGAHAQPTGQCQCSQQERFVHGVRPVRVQAGWRRTSWRSLIGQWKAAAETEVEQPEAAVRQGFADRAAQRLVVLARGTRRRRFAERACEG
jgi:hypothetical protein